ncbi:Ubiquinone/menaquinone biosynthesis C-methylase UbiE [Nitrosomonas aestuarii]|uniref:Ubiquinone/menaquinone biosynthesis C-methylase UbiE n=1 Tax=Nitrosomonas aestuarii TaxID=52441 RepID=A0A1I4BUY0_9PROT|nr:class I SAM-dependent methyltransferase [Nitrosomonas aestuarii]SFK72230.1 Ubiquinone/menaquinone biosynthesis C-methylase UbiE [Nitrosomonas aestuarii]
MTKQKLNHKNYVPALGYHWLTPFYDPLIRFAGRGNLLKDALIVQARLEKGQQVLDLGCGTGALAILIKRDFPSVGIAALDCDRKMLSIAERKASQIGVDIQFEHAFAENLPYPVDSFDRVVSSLFFHHLSWGRKKQVANELFRVLKPGGELHVIDWGRASNKLMRCLFFVVQLVDGFSNTQDNVSGRLIEVFCEAGFSRVCQHQSLNTIFGTLTLYTAVKAAGK